MSEETGVQKISDASLFQILTPKQEDIIRFIGVDNFKKEISFAIQAANANDYLSKASPQSVAKAIYNLAITGLSLNPVSKLAYLIPKNIKGTVEAVLMPSYQGLVKLLVDCGAALAVESRIVYEGDVFTPEYGTNANIHHVPKSSGKGKEIIAVYAVCTLRSGVKLSDVMWKDEIDEIRELSDSYKSFLAGKTKTCIWIDWYGEMSKKTVVRRMFKMIPKSKGINFEKVAQAIELDNQEYQASIEQVHMIEGLLGVAAIEAHERDSIEREMNDYTHHQASACIAYLQQRKLDPIESGNNYGAGDIAKKIAEKMEDDKA